MKLKKFLQSNKMMTAGATIIIIFISIVVMTYGIQHDKTKQEQGEEEIITLQDTETNSPQSGDTRADSMNVAENGQTIDMKDVEVTVIGSVPKKTGITVEEAAKIGMQAVALQSGSKGGKCKLEMSYVSYSGTTEQGYWKGKAVLDDENYYEFKLDGADGKLRSCTSFTRGGAGEAWVDNNNQVIAEDNLEAFTGISVDLISHTKCKIVSDNHYSLNMNRKDKGYTLTYEIKNGILTIEEGGKGNEDNQWKDDEQLVIGVPEDVKLDMITISKNTLSIMLEGIKSKKLDIKGSNKSLSVKKSEIDTMDTSLPNSSVSLEDSQFVSTSFKLTNMSLNIEKCQFDKGRWEGQNSSINVNKIDVKDGTFKVNCSSLNFAGGNKGKIKIDAAFSSVNIGDKKDSKTCEYDVKNENGSTSWGNGFSFAFDF